MTDNTPALPGAQNSAVVPSNRASTLPIFASSNDFDSAQRMAMALAKSSMVPVGYRDNIPNCLIALEYAGQCRMSVLAVMQNLNVIEGRPSWSSTFLIATINTTGKFSPVRYEREDRGKPAIMKTTWSGPKGARVAKTEKVTIDDFAYRVKVIEKATGEVLIGPWISMEMAHQEGWYDKAGSKYKVMPETMLMYRAASAFSRLYCPENSLGMHTTDEVRETEWAEYEDVTPNTQPAKKSAAAKINEDITNDAPTNVAASDAQIVPDAPAPPPVAAPPKAKVTIQAAPPKEEETATDNTDDGDANIPEDEYELS